MRGFLFVPAALSAAIASSAAISEQPASSPAQAVVTPIVRTDRTISNQPLKLPPSANAEVVAASVDIPPGAATTVHQHPWSRIVYVERGPLRVINHATGETRDFESGTVLPEVVAQWHEGRAMTTPVRVIVIDLVPKGENNMIMRPAGKM